MESGYRPSSIFAPLGKTLLVTLGGYLLVLSASVSTMSHAEKLLGPLALGLLWAGFGYVSRSDPR